MVLKEGILLRGLPWPPSVNHDRWTWELAMIMSEIYCEDTQPCLLKLVSNKNITMTIYRFSEDILY